MQERLGDRNAAKHGPACGLPYTCASAARRGAQQACCAAGAGATAAGQL